MEKRLIPRCVVIAKAIFDDLGVGFDEVIYQKSFEVSLREEGLRYENQRVIPVFFHGHHVGESKLDLVVSDGEEKVIIELKAMTTSLSPKEETQLRKYMALLNIVEGLLINFVQAGRKAIPDEPEIIEVSL